jgi:AcrR family transcriptional regulator
MSSISSRKRVPSKRAVHSRHEASEPAAPVGTWGEREQAIIEVAWSLYAEKGYENVSMAAVAKAAGLSEGTLYNYFRDKQDLVLRVSGAHFDRHIADAERIVADCASLRDGLEGLISVQLTIILEAREIYRIWLREVRGARNYRQSQARTRLRRLSNLLVALLEDFGVNAEAATGLTRANMRDMVFGGVEHTAFTAIVQRREKEVDVARLAASLTEAYMRAFGLDDGVPKRRTTRGATA